MSRKIIISTFIISLFLGTSCSKNEAEFLALPAVTADAVYETNNYIVISSGDANHRGMAIYDELGNYISQMTNFRDPTKIGYPRGIAQFDNNNILVALDANDRVEMMSLDDYSTTTFYYGTLLNGYIYDLEVDSNSNAYVTESSRIEQFDNTGFNTTPVYINTTVGGCTISNARQMAIDKTNNILIAASYSNARILRYDISGSTSSCLNSTATASNPYGVLLHSNGDIYYTTWGNDQIYRANADMSGATVIFATDTSTLNNPTSLVELPDGTILVASSATDTVEQFEADGTHIGTYIRDTQTLNITDIKIITRTELVE